VLEGEALEAMIAGPGFSVQRRRSIPSEGGAGRLAIPQAFPRQFGQEIVKFAALVWRSLDQPWIDRPPFERDRLDSADTDAPCRCGNCVAMDLVVQLDRFRDLLERPADFAERPAIRATAFFVRQLVQLPRRAALVPHSK